MPVDTLVTRRTFIAAALAAVAVGPLGLAREPLTAPRPFAFEHDTDTVIWVTRGRRFAIVVKDRRGRRLEVHRRIHPRQVHSLTSAYFRVVPVDPPTGPPG